MSYQFTLSFALPDPGTNPDRYLDALYEAGCSDALLGIGQVGLVSLDFDREAADAVVAVRSAITDVRKAIPGAQIIEVSPDLVGMTEIAGALGISRQMVRKYVLSKAEFPRPVHTSEAVALWHLVEVVAWAETAPKFQAQLHPSLKEIAAVTFRINFELQQVRQERLATAILGAGKARRVASAVRKSLATKAEGTARKKSTRRATGVHSST